MLKKCMKYDFKAYYKIFIALSAALLALSVIGGLSINSIANEPTTTIKILGIVGTSIFVVLAMFYPIVTFGVGIHAYYRNFRTDEAYLTFTLPVKRETLLLSKLLTTMISLVCSLVVLTVSVTICLALIKDGESTVLGNFTYSIGESIREGYREKGFWYVVNLSQIVIIIVSCVFTAMFACFWIVNKASWTIEKHRQLSIKDIGIALLIYFGIGFITAPILAVSFAIEGYFNAVEIAGTVTAKEAHAIYFFFLIIITALITIINTLFYRSNLRAIKDKLNLT